MDNEIRRKFLGSSCLDLPGSIAVETGVAAFEVLRGSNHLLLVVRSAHERGNISCRGNQQDARENVTKRCEPITSELLLRCRLQVVVALRLIIFCILTKSLTGK